MSKLPCFRLHQAVSREGRSRGGKCLDSEREQTTQEQVLEVTLLASGNKSAVSYLHRLALGFFLFYKHFFRISRQNWKV